MRHWDQKSISKKFQKQQKATTPIKVSRDKTTTRVLQWMDKEWRGRAGFYGAVDVEVGQVS